MIDFFDTLFDIAPHCDRAMLRVVAALLSAGAHDAELRATAGALAEAAAEVLRHGRLRESVQLLAVAHVVDRRLEELARRPGIWR